MANLYDTPYFEDYNIINQANVEKGINLLRSNQGIVNTLDTPELYTIRVFCENLSV